MNQSYSFDRAADFYDATRAYPPDVANKITQSILDLTGAQPSTRIFELGIGTGRIAAPLIARGLNVSGLDLSREMMLKLHGKFSSGTPLRLVQGDASALPFRDAAFDVVLAVHVFHLIAPWQQAIWQLRRVLSPGGIVLHSTHLRDDHSPNVILRDKWHELVEAHGERWKRPGAVGWRGQAIKTEFQALGASVEEVEVTRSTSTTTPQQEIADIAARVSSDTWAVSDPVLEATVTELTEWARGRFGTLDTPWPEETVYVWQVFHFDRAPLLPELIRAALARLVPILNATGSPWVLGGSCSLALHGVTVEPHDIDISTDQAGAYRIGETLRKVAEEKQAVRWGESAYIRSHHGLYQMGDVSVDVIGAAELREGDDWMPARLPSEWETDAVPIPGTDLAVAAFTLEYERVAYRRLQREAQVRLIEDRLTLPTR
jgi:ubiquinone/menaquinone biosynthesis C-methylase UbiE